MATQISTPAQDDGLHGERTSTSRYDDLTTSPALPGTILVIDDVAANAHLIAKTLVRHGLEDVHTETDPTRALARIDELDPDVILLDLRMPEVDGFEILSALHASAKDGFLPVMVLTAETDTEARHQALRDGAIDFLNKPLDLAEVVQRTRNLLRVRQLHLLDRERSLRLERVSRERSEALDAMTDDLRAIHSELEDMTLDGLMRLAKAAEFRDDDTGQHTIRVGHWSEAVARRLELPDPFCSLLGTAARLHDVGKIGIPDSILLKPGRLNADERATMQQHCEIGAAILDGGRGELIDLARSVAIHHHERWDGEGYPYGRCGADIPIEGRIVAVVDVFDSLTHARPYKVAWGVRSAIDLLMRERNRHFDPDVVDALVALVYEARANPTEAYAQGFGDLLALED